MANPTSLVNLTPAKLGEPDNPIVKVATPMSATATTLVATSPGFVDEDGTALATPFQISVRITSGDYKNYVEQMEVTAVAADDVTATVVRGTSDARDYTAGNADFAKAIPRDSIVEIAPTPQMQNMIVDAIQGSIATGGNIFQIGDGTETDNVIAVLDDTGSRSILRRDDSTDKVQYAHDGSDWTDIDKSDKSMTIIVNDVAEDATVSDGQVYFRIPTTLTGMKLSEAHGNVVTAGTTGNTTIQINNTTTTNDMLSSLITIASAATSGSGTVSATYAPVTAADVLRIDVDTVSTTAPKGLFLTLVFTQV